MTRHRKTRQSKLVAWRTFQRFLLAEFTIPSDTVPGKLFCGSLRGFLMDDPRWGITARPELIPKLRAHIRLPFNRDWDLDTVLQNPELVKQTLGPSGHTRKDALALIALWGPRGPLKIPETMWRTDPRFNAWLAEQSPDA